MMRPLSPRWSIPLVLVVLLLPACTDSGDGATDTTTSPTTTAATTTTTTTEPPRTGQIGFDHVLDMPTGTSVWTATGEAVDSDILCSTATGGLEGFEDADGAVRTPEDIGALFEVGEPFVNVSVESMTCDDGSGDFTLRFHNEIDPSISVGEPVTRVTWTITGGTGYGTTTGEGDNEIPRTDGDSFFYNGTGTITEY